MNPEGLVRLVVAGLVSLGLFGLLGCGKSKSETPANTPTTIEVEGRLLHVSPIPDPTANDYKDCLFTTTFEVNGVSRVQAGDAQQDAAIPERMVLVMPAFLDRKLTPQAALKSGQTLRAQLCRFDQLGRPFSRMQQADTVEDIDLPLYFSDQVEVITSFRSLPKPEVQEFAAIAQSAITETPTFQPSTAQQAAIANAIERIRERRDAHGGWDKWTAELAPVIEQIAASTAAAPPPVFDEPFSVRSFRSLTMAFAPDHPERVNTSRALIQLRDGLALGGTELIVAPVPDRDLVGVDQIYASLRPDDGIWNPHRLRRNLHVLEQGIEILDSSEAMRAAATAWRSSPTNMPLFFFESHDGHPAGGAVRVHGEAIAERVRASVPRLPGASGLVLSWYDIKSPPAYAAAPFRSQHRHPILSENATMHPDNPASPVLLFGDSYLQNPGGGGISDIVGAGLGHVPHQFMRSSGALEMPRHLARSPRHRKGKKVAVLVFNEALLDPHHESWLVVDFSRNKAEFERYVRLSAEGELRLNYNSQEDFAALVPRETDAGFVADARRAYIPYAAAGPLHIDCLPTRYRDDRPMLLSMQITNRKPQTMTVLMDGKELRSVPLTHDVNKLHLVFEPTPGRSQLSLRFPKDGGNLFIEALRVFESSVEN